MARESPSTGEPVRRVMPPEASPQRGSARHAALAGIVDYAGFFPPARLSVSVALGNYLTYRESGDRWMLGRFVIPAARLAELQELLQAEPRPVCGLPVTALLGPDLRAELAAVQRFNAETSRHGALVESVEAKAPSEEEIRATLSVIPGSWRSYLELPTDAGPELLDAVVAAGAWLKLRTGGTTPEAFPEPNPLLRTLKRAVWRRLPLKATAGLHHPLRGDYPLTYEPAAPSGTMYGFLNLLLAGAVLWTRHSLAEAKAALLEEEAAAIRFEGSALCWRAVRISDVELADVRRSFFQCFGSCSFREPVDELTAGGW